MRAGLPFSIAIHLGLALAGVVVIPNLSKAEPTPMVILPVELLTVAETTNVAPVVEQPKPDAKEEETAPSQAAAPAAAAPVPEEIIPDPVAKPPEPKKPETKKEDFNASLQSILKDVKKSKTQVPDAEKKASSIRSVEDAAEARRGAGDRERMTISVADFIRSQMLAKGCWGDQDDMPDAKRLRATFRIKFGPDGHFLEEPKLVDREPYADHPMEVFVGRARAGLNKCNQLGFQVPALYYQHQPAQWIDITFLP